MPDVEYIDHDKLEDKEIYEMQIVVRGEDAKNVVELLWSVTRLLYIKKANQEERETYLDAFKDA